MKPGMWLMVLGLALALPAGAHHSGAAFDRNKSVTVIGTVNSVEWTSPHARLKIDAKDEAGVAVTWDFELPSPVTLTRRGWTKSALTPGDKITVTGLIFISRAFSSAFATMRLAFARFSVDIPLLRNRRYEMSHCGTEDRKSSR